jgi:putative GTP pyrophosphokinase
MSEALKEKHKGIVVAYEENYDAFEYFYKNVINFFESRKLKNVVHSVRHRLKDVDHLLEKVERKNREDLERKPELRLGKIDESNIFKRITDIAGVRILHLHLSQFGEIHSEILKKVCDEEFVLVEKPKAYTWDPDSECFFKSLDILTEQKESFYTSIHYVLKPNSRSIATCEVQVRTLIEEVWGEVDHAMNYPNQITDEQCQEQIRVLARLVAAGGHLADSIMRRYGNRH